MESQPLLENREPTTATIRCQQQSENNTGNDTGEEWGSVRLFIVISLNVLLLVLIFVISSKKVYETT